MSTSYPPCFSPKGLRHAHVRQWCEYFTAILEFRPTLSADVLTYPTMTQLEQGDPGQELTGGKPNRTSIHFLKRWS